MSALSNDKPMPSTQKVPASAEQTLANIEDLFQAMFAPESNAVPLMNDVHGEQSG